MALRSFSTYLRTYLLIT